ncbi:MAG: glycosyltransferase family 39 protein [Nitrospirae bacterium]|nr:glycosyltransferase family 39 protein [Nitrospirota bacterium]
MPFITAMPFLFFAPFILFFIISRRVKIKDTLFVLLICAVSAGLSDGTSSILKTLFERLRPCHAIDGVNLLVGCSESFSFPSNHASNAFALAGALTYFFKKEEIKNVKFLNLSLFFISALIAFSRVYVGVHYPSDVIFGALIGTLASLAVLTGYKWAKKNIETDRLKTLFILTTVALTILRFFYINTGLLDLSPDEAHYWDWSRRLDLSYYSKGPMMAYLMALTTGLMGSSVFAVRFFAPVFLALTSVIVYKLTKEMSGNELPAVTAGLLIHTTPLFAAYGVLMTIDSPFVFFWALALYLFWKAIQQGTGVRDSGLVNNLQKYPQTPNPKYWLLLGITIGLGLLTKYTMAFFYACAFLFIVFSKEQRHWLKEKEPYIALAISLTVFSPVIIWNAGQNWVTLKHTAGQAHISEEIKISFKSFFEFLGSQAGVLTPLLFAAVIYGALKAYKSRSLFTVHRSLFLFCFWAPILGFFILKSIQAKVEANWATPAYLTAFIAFSLFFLNRDTIKKGTKIFLILAVTMAFSVTLISHYTDILNLPSKKDPTSRLKGWKELGQETGKIYNDLSLRGDVFVFSDSYQVTSELAFYTPGRPRTYCVNLGRRMNQYDIWGGFDKLTGKNAIFVKIGAYDLPAGLKGTFNSFERQEFIAKRNDKVLREYSIFKCYGFKGLPPSGTESY